MRLSKTRLTVTVDPELVEAGQRAVKAGQASSLSSWVNAALSERAQKEKKLRAMAKAVAEYEAEFGVITEAQMQARLRADRRNAIVVGSPRRRRAS